jgi:hypothetical protein
MRLGIDSYLGLRIVFSLLTAGGLYLCLSKLAPEHPRSAMLPVLITLGPLTMLVSLISYNTTPVYLLLISIGLLYGALDDSRSRWRVAWAGLAGLSASVSGFLNFTIYPAALFSMAVIWLAYGRPRVLLIGVISFVAFSALAVGTYLATIGLTRFLVYPGGHNLFVARAVDLLRLVGDWALLLGIPIVCIWIACRFFRPLDSGKWFFAGALPVLLVPCLLCEPILWDKLWDSQWGGPSCRVIAHTDLLKSRWIQLLPRFTCFGMLGFWAIAILVASVLLCVRRTEIFKRSGLAILCVLAYMFCQGFFSLMEIPSLTIFYAGPFLALGLYLLHETHAAEHPKSSWFFRSVYGAVLAMVLLAAVGYSVRYAHPGLLNPIDGRRVSVSLPRLKGLRETPERLATLLWLNDVYLENDCANRTLITYNCTPFLYYLFDHPAPPQLEYIYVPYIWSADLIQRTLDHSNRWCVFVSANFLNEMAVWTITQPVTDYLEKHSERVIRRPTGTPPAHVYDDFVVYIGPKRLSSE